MVNQFAKRYVAADWKKKIYGFDLLNTKPYLDRIAATTNDLDFYDVCVDYVAQFHDGGHVYFEVPSDFLADTGIRVDTFDGKPLVYAINRTALPAAKFPFKVGDEIVSIDGTPAATLMDSLAKYGILSNPRTQAAYAALYLTVRPQSVIPHAVDVPDMSTIVMRSSDGSLQTYMVPWNKTGVPLRAAGPVPSPYASAQRKSSKLFRSDWEDDQPSSPFQGKPAYSMVRPSLAVSGIGTLRPVFNLPTGFKLRLGANTATDAFYSGTFTSGNYTIGFIRVPTFDPSVDVDTAVNQFAAEIAYFQANTNGLVIDDMRNPGGLVYYGEELVRRLIPKPFRYVGFELRSTTEWVLTYSDYLQFLQALNYSNYFTTFYQDILNDVTTAYGQSGGHTGPEPLDLLALSPFPMDPGIDQYTPLLNRNGTPAAYTKPILVLTDEFSGSGADYFPATLQDNGAATIFGMRTMGLGGTNTAYNAGAYSEATVGMLRGLMVRKNPVTAPGFPATTYIENIGVQPDIVEDYKTRDNLLNGGATFVTDFTAAIVNLIQKSSQ